MMVFNERKKKKKKKKKKEFDTFASFYVFLFYLFVPPLFGRILFHSNLGPVKRICVFEHSVMTNFNCVCPAIQRDQGSGFLSEGSS